MKRGLLDPRKVAALLGLVNERSERQARGIIVNCPSHTDRGRPNCSITTGKDGTVRVKCHACDYKGDVLTLIATVHGLNMRDEFRQVLLVGAELAGNHALAAELEDGKPRPDRIHIPEPRQLPEAPWAPNVSITWDRCLPISYDAEAIGMLRARGFDVDRAEALNLLRTLPQGVLPSWASFGRRDWRQTGHRLVVRQFDADGTVRALRAWRVTDGDTPKRLPPSGCRSAGLVLANRLGHQLLCGGKSPSCLLVVEGEPDWLAATLAAPGAFAVWGIGSGSWTDALAARARAVSRVIVATHPDDAGDRYARLVTGSVKRAVRWRPKSDLDLIGVDLQSQIGIAAKWLFVPHSLGD